MSRSHAVFYYVSGHGFGHAVRSAEVIHNLLKLDPDLRIFIRTKAPAGLFPERLGNISVEPIALDIGVIQRDSLRMDISETLSAYRRLETRLDILIEQELAAVRQSGTDLIVGDIPAAVFRISRRANIPGIAVGNFSWDWIYRGWSERYPEAGRIADRIQADYERCDLLMKLPFSGPMDAFHRIEAVPMIARSATLPSEEVRRRLELDEKRPLVLLSFGRISLEAPLVPDNLSKKKFQFVSTADFGIQSCRVYSDSALSRKGIRYPDLVAAADIVVSKPGYGIVTECIANRTRLLYTDRGLFPEYGVLTREMRLWLPAVYIPQEPLLTGNWYIFLVSLLEKRFPDKKPDVNGARRIAERLLEILKGRS